MPISIRILKPIPVMPLARAFDADDLGQVFAAHGRSVLGIGHGDKQAHAEFVAGFAGLEIDAGARDAHGAAKIVEVFFLGVGRANTHQLRDLAAAGAATFGRDASGAGVPFCGVLLMKSCVAMT